MFKNDTDYLEIGPGKGTLTRIITPKVGKMYAIELDKRLKPYLEEIPNLNIIWGSVLDVEIPKVDKIITSLPYSIIEPFIYKMIKTNFQEMYMLMGDKYILNVVNKEITKLSVVTNSFFKTEILLEVPPVAFDIQPRTDSYIVKMVKVEVPKEKKYQLYREIYLLLAKVEKNRIKKQEKPCFFSRIIIQLYCVGSFAPIAQLDRALDYGSKG